jgi:hypothetical protein
MIDYFKMMYLLTALHKAIANLRNYAEAITNDLREYTQDEKDYLIRVCDLMHTACDLGTETQQLFIHKEKP